MIKIAGSIHRSFSFPADKDVAFNYYCDIPRTLSFLRHIELLNRFDDTTYRLVYATSELGIYRVRVFCDIQTEIDRQSWALRIFPFEGISEIRSKSGMYSLSGQGVYTSESIFKEDGAHTEIEYKLKLSATLPVPLGLRFMPTKLINQIAREITKWRMQEIVDGFIERSLSVFQGKPVATTVTSTKGD